MCFFVTSQIFIEQVQYNYLYVGKYRILLFPHQGQGNKNIICQVKSVICQGMLFFEREAGNLKLVLLSLRAIIITINILQYSGKNT